MARLIGEELDEKRRTQILEAALYCFLTFGFAKTSMDDIARRAGVSRPLIYLKFKNKDELFAGVFDYLTEGRFERAMAAIKTGGSPRERLLASTPAGDSLLRAQCRQMRGSGCGQPRNRRSIFLRDGRTP